MKNWTRQYPPYEGEEPYLYFAFAEADGARVWKILRILLSRGCRVWYSIGAAGGAKELLRRQKRAAGAAMTLLYLSDAACADMDTKSNILVNQKNERPILCLDPDETDRRLSMGLREDVPHIRLFRLLGKDEIESALIHAEGFSQEMFGEPVKIRDGGILQKLTVTFCVMTALLLAAAVVGLRFFHWFRPEYRDEVTIEDPVLLDAVRQAVGGGPLTQEQIDQVSFLSFEELPESWDELSMLPALERIELPQQALLENAELPAGDYVVELSGGEGA